MFGLTLRKDMKVLKIGGKVLPLIFILISGFTISGCAPGKAKEKTTSGGSNKPLSEAEKKEKAEQDRLNAERRSQESALRNKIYVGHKKLELIASDSDKILARITLDVNGEARPMLLSIDLKNEEQFNIQDRTENIRDLVPNSYFEVSSYRFMAGSIPLLALSYRTQKTVANHDMIATQMVLMVLDKSLGPLAIKKTQFDFPSKRDLLSWAKEIQKAEIENSSDETNNNR